MDEQELADIEKWFNEPSDEEDHWARVFNGGRVIARLIEALRTERARVQELEGKLAAQEKVIEAAKAVSICLAHIEANGNDPVADFAAGVYLVELQEAVKAMQEQEGKGQ